MQRKTSVDRIDRLEPPQPLQVSSQSSAQTTADAGPTPDGQPRTPDEHEADPDETLESELSRTEIFEILSNPRRRAVIAYLSDRESVVQLRDLAEALAAWENEIPVHQVTYKQRKRVYTSLYQSHLPKMGRLGVVEFDKNRGTVESTQWTSAMEGYLDALGPERQSWRFAALGAGALAAVAFGGSTIGSVPLGVASLSGVSLGLSLALLVLSIGRYRASR